VLAEAAVAIYLTAAAVLAYAAAAAVLTDTAVAIYPTAAAVLADAAAIAVFATAAIATHVAATAATATIRTIRTAMAHPQLYMLTHYAPQPYMPLPYPPQPPPQSNPALDNVATQMAKLAMAMERRQDAVQTELASMRNAPANERIREELGAPALKPGDVATFEPRNQSDSDAALRFIDSIRDAVSHYGEERTRVVLRRCCKGSPAEDWLAGMSDHDRALLRASCRHWITIIE